MLKKKKKFLRRDNSRFSKLGKKRKKLQKWRKPKGRDNKMREKRFGYPKLVNLGDKSSKKKSGKIQGFTPCLIYNIKDLAAANKNSIIIIGKVGAKSKLEIIKNALKMKLRIGNIAKASEESNAIK